jgi:hypothetical protein
MANEDSGLPLLRWKPFFHAFEAIVDSRNTKFGVTIIKI